MSQVPIPAVGAHVWNVSNSDFQRSIRTSGWHSPSEGTLNEGLCLSQLSLARHVKDHRKLYLINSRGIALGHLGTNTLPL